MKTLLYLGLTLLKKRKNNPEITNGLYIICNKFKFTTIHFKYEEMNEVRMYCHSYEFFSPYHGLMHPDQKYIH